VRVSKARMSSIESSINMLIVLVCCLLFVLCFLGAIARNTTTNNLKNEGWYLDFDVEVTPDDPLGDVTDSTSIIWMLCQCFVLLNAFVSVSLMLSVYVVKKVQSWFMEQSLEMYHKESDTPMKVRCMFLVDELGRVSHVFSDKTGTLTQNIMQFRKCSIGGKAYGKGHTEIGLARLARLGQAVSSESLRAEDTAPEAGPGGGPNAVNFEGPELFKALQGTDAHSDVCRDFFKLLALCHTVVLETVDGVDKISASSPDEAALVAAASFFGCEFVKRDKDQVFIKEAGGKTLSFTVLAVLDFTSARKRMSVLLRDDATSKISLLSKGADNVMLKLLHAGQEELVRHTENHMQDHSNDGLRTLVLAQKAIDEASYQAWVKEYNAACGSQEQLEAKEKEMPNEIDRLMALMEQGLTLLGSTAIEDKLQEGVPAAIADMSRAGIGVWVLTGDKEETAINIAFACQLLDTSTTIRIINTKSHPNSKRMAEDLVEWNRAAKEGGPKEKHALVIDGEAIDMVMRDVDCKLKMLVFTQSCYSIVGCRCAPSQKAQLVELVKFNVDGAITLAIGDGANDVAMIKAAHCGVGISGQEGLQAANSADFAIAQFRFLKEMLLVHGRNNYRRMATMVMYIVYKNMVLTFSTFWFSIYCAWSSQKFYNEALSTAFNVIWTGVPILIISIFDKDVEDSTARRLPQIYHVGVRCLYYNPWVILRWFSDTLLESFWILIVVASSLALTDPPEGNDPSVFFLGGHVFTMVLLVVSFKLWLWQWQVTTYQVISFVFFVLIWWPFASWSSNESQLVDTFMGFDMYAYFGGWTGLWGNVVRNSSFWLLCLLIPAGALLPQVFVVVWKRTFYPEFRDLAMEAEWWGLPMEPLEKTAIPMAMRRLPLLKDAPLSIEKRTFWSKIGGKSSSSYL